MDPTTSSTCETRAADALKISRFALQRKLEKYGIVLPDTPE